MNDAAVEIPGQERRAGIRQQNPGALRRRGGDALVSRGGGELEQVVIEAVLLGEEQAVRGAFVDDEA